MKINIITKNQMKEEIKEQIEKRDYKLFRLLNILERRILKLEETDIARNSKIKNINSNER